MFDAKSARDLLRIQVMDSDIKLIEARVKEACYKNGTWCKFTSDEFSRGWVYGSSPTDYQRTVMAKLVEAGYKVKQLDECSMFPSTSLVISWE